MTETLEELWREAVEWNELRRAREEGERKAIFHCITLYLEEEYGSDGKDMIPRVKFLTRYDSLLRFYILLIRAGCLRDAVRYLPTLPAEAT